MPGFLFYEGPSRIDRMPIAGVATYGTENAKTGDLVQTWIFRTDMNPVQAISVGADHSICGNCPLRGRVENERNRGRGCYVAVQNAPLSVYGGYTRGIYPQIGQAQNAGEMLAGRGLRYGSYGDPVAIPMRFWTRLSELCTGRVRTGYTHQWRDRRFRRWSSRLMASTHSRAENDLAQSLGWRTFRTVVAVDGLTHGEILCPASKEAEYRATCERCGACNGRRDEGDRRYSVGIVVHGSPSHLPSARKVISLL